MQPAGARITISNATASSYYQNSLTYGPAHVIDGRQRSARSCHRSQQARGFHPVPFHVGHPEICAVAGRAAARRHSPYDQPLSVGRPDGALHYRKIPPNLARRAAGDRNYEALGLSLRQGIAKTGQLDAEIPEIMRDSEDGVITLTMEETSAPEKSPSA